jgi:hypothetical protein
MNGIIQSHWAVIGSIKCNISHKNFLREIFLIEFRSEIYLVGKLAIQKVLLVVMVLRMAQEMYPKSIFCRRALAEPV